MEDHFKGQCNKIPIINQIFAIKNKKIKGFPKKVKNLINSKKGYKIKFGLAHQPWGLWHIGWIHSTWHHNKHQVSGSNHGSVFYLEKSMSYGYMPLDMN